MSSNKQLKFFFFDRAKSNFFPTSSNINNLHLVEWKNEEGKRNSQPLTNTNWESDEEIVKTTIISLTTTSWVSSSKPMLDWLQQAWQIAQWISLAWTLTLNVFHVIPWIFPTHSSVIQKNRATSISRIWRCESISTTQQAIRIQFKLGRYDSVFYRKTIPGWVLNCQKVSFAFFW